MSRLLYILFGMLLSLVIISIAAPPIGVMIVWFLMDVVTYFTGHRFF